MLALQLGGCGLRGVTRAVIVALLRRQGTSNTKWLYGGRRRFMAVSPMQGSDAGQIMQSTQSLEFKVDKHIQHN